MKKIIAFTLIAGAATAACAQSNVTLFGIVDAGVRYTKNGDDSARTVSANGVNTSRLGFRGTEDLGAGLKASFWLETGFNPDTGTQSDASRFFNRRATVSLLGAFGELRLGRDTTPTYNAFADYDAFGTNGVGDASKFVSKLGTNVDTLVRADNLASYFTPSKLGGFYAHVAAAAPEGSTGKKYYGARAGFAAGPLDVSASYGQTTVAALVAGEDKFKTATVGAAYDFGVLKVTGFVAQTKYADLRNTVIDLGALVPVGPGTLRVSYADIDAKGRTAQGVRTDDNDASQIAVGYVYDLSKRTALYSTVARVNNKNAAAYVVDANPALPSPNNGKDSTGVEVGIRHRF